MKIMQKKIIKITLYVLYLKTMGQHQIYVNFVQKPDLYVMFIL